MTGVLVTGMAAADFVFQLDRLPRAGAKYRAKDVEIVGGGTAANAAAAIARLGGAAILVTRVGDDGVGRTILADLRAEGVDCDAAMVAPGGRSPLSSIYVDAAGERQVVNFRGDGLAEHPGDLASIAGRIGAVLVDTRWPEAARAGLEFARSLGIPGVVDAEAPVPEGLLDGASHVAFALAGLRDFTGVDKKSAALRAAAGRLDSWICVTDGAAGVNVVQGGEVTNVPAFAVDAVDTLGAGDVWHGAFALRLAEGADEMTAARFANAAAALKCTGFGGRRAAPGRSETENLLKEMGCPT